MRKLLHIFQLSLLMVGCSPPHLQSNVKEIDTTDIIINGSFVAVYDMVTGDTIYERIYGLGDFKVCENGDTLFYIPDCDDVSWVTSEEWHSKWEKLFDYPEILGEIKLRRVE